MMLPFEPPQSSLGCAYADSLRGVPHEGVARGLGSGMVGQWQYGPRPNPYLRAHTPPAGWTHVLGWGQAFYHEAATQAGSVMVRNLQTWAIGDAGWVLLHEGRPSARVFEPTYSAPGTPASAAPGTGVLAAAWHMGDALHFWGERRAIPAGLRGFLVTCEARADVPALLGLGADYYKDATSMPVQGDYSVNCDVGIGRLRRVGSEWRTFGWTSASLDDLRKL